MFREGRVLFDLACSLMMDPSWEVLGLYRASGAEVPETGFTKAQGSQGKDYMRYEKWLW